MSAQFSNKTTSVAERLDLIIKQIEQIHHYAEQRGEIVQQIQYLNLRKFTIFFIDIGKLFQIKTPLCSIKWRIDV